MGLRLASLFAAAMMALIWAPAALACRDGADMAFTLRTHLPPTLVSDEIALEVHRSAPDTRSQTRWTFDVVRVRVGSYSEKQITLVNGGSDCDVFGLGGIVVGKLVKTPEGKSVLRARQYKEGGWPGQEFEVFPSPAEAF